MLSSQKLNDTIKLFKSKPNFSIYGETDDGNNYCHNLTEDRIDSPQDKAPLEIAARKDLVKSGLKKLMYPTFQRDIQNY